MSLLILVTYLLLMEMPPTTPSWPYKDKVQHIIVFLALTTSGGLAFQNRCVALCVMLAVYGAMMEVLQSVLTVTRIASVYDWLADVTGILIATVILRLLSKWSNQNSSIL
ncbi:MAG TPA: VanZ family protein [Methylophilaceae bacterium]